MYIYFTNVLNKSKQIATYSERQAPQSTGHLGDRALPIQFLLCENKNEF